MPLSLPKPCTVAGCPELVRGKGRCEEHVTKAEQARGTSTQRGYTSQGHRYFRHNVLARNPICVICNKAAATEADHHPYSRKQLIEQGLNPNRSEYGRGLCKPCHGSQTAQHQPGGWNARQ